MHGSGNGAYWVFFLKMFLVFFVEPISFALAFFVLLSSLHAVLVHQSIQCAILPIGILLIKDTQTSSSC